MKNPIIILFFTIIMFSCASPKRLTIREKEIINSSNSNTPFNVLKITDKQDSIFLREISKDINLSRDKQLIDILIQRLKLTLDAENGVGIAAPQIGISRNLFLMMRFDKPDKNIEVVINPKIISRPDEKVIFERDGCLSIPDERGNSWRYPWIIVEYYNEKGKKITEKLSGYSRQTDFTGIIFQHEYDHLQGIMFTDKLCK